MFFLYSCTNCPLPVGSQTAMLTPYISGMSESQHTSSHSVRSFSCTIESSQP
ncbi:unnamed protein product [Ectocarpus sp. CCAP 1310/34]|nr:unnamed protein product [Ectocarpus sp. CCAP 1310/34]